MYSIDGFPLDNPDLEWTLRATSTPHSSHSVERTSLRVPGLPGVVAGVDHPLEALSGPTIGLVVRTPAANFGALTSLLLTGRKLSLTDTPSREAAIESLTTPPEGSGDADAWQEISATYRLPGVFWRDVDQSTHSTPLTAAVVTADAWAMDGLVSDAMVRVRGAATGLRVESDYAYLEYSGALAAGQYLRYECATGRSWLTTTDAWSGGTEVSGQVSADGPAGKFGVFPTRLGALLSRARTTVRTASRAGAQIEIRGKGAHLVVV